MDGLIVRTDSAGRWTYFGDNWPNRARHWIPSIDHPSDKATVTWRVRAPAGRTVVANGHLVSTRQVSDGNGAERTEWTWRESRPIPGLLDGHRGRAAHAIRFRRHRLRARRAAALRSAVRVHGARAAPDACQVRSRARARSCSSSRVSSGPFPYEKLAHVQSSTRFGGMENASAIFYADGNFPQRGRWRLVAHETAHQWFGDAVTERDWPHLWLSEGFATYFAALWTRAARATARFARR